jgi:hypothetical protein
MLSDDEIVPEIDEADEIKDFAYYADLAEDWLAEAERFTPEIWNVRKFEHAMRAADVYARLAAAAATSPSSEPESVESPMIWRHADGCPCVTKG